VAASCPACQRPVAAVQPRCLYCGAQLPPAVMEEAQKLREEALAETAGPGGTATPPASAERDLVLVDFTHARAGGVAAAFGVGRFDADLRVRRGGWQLHRVWPRAEARREADRLLEHALPVMLLAEAEVEGASLPLLARGVKDGRFRFTDDEPVAASTADVLLVVVGPIRREHQRSPGAPRRLGPRRESNANVDETFRFHVHRTADIRPVEIDPLSFSLDDGMEGSTLLRVRSWLSELAGDRPWDDGFKNVPVTLGVSPSPPPGDEVRSALGAPRRKEGVVLDNLRQFRFHSAWRGLLERRLRAG
jgi:hypothetical protein